MNKPVTIGVILLSALAMTACSTTAPASNPGPGDTTAPTSITKVTVGVIPILATAPIWLGAAKGFFTDEGIDLDIQSGGGGAAVVPGVVAGDYDFAFGNFVSVMLAREKGLDLTFVANGNSADGTPAAGAVIVPTDSPIKSPKDLVGKTVAVNNLQNINDVTIRTVVDEDGGDSSKIKFVEIAAPDNEAALANRQVDAARIPSPFDIVAVANGNRILFYNYPAFDSKLSIAGYFTKGDMVKNKPDVVKAFQKAMNKSIEYAQSHPDEVREIVTTYTKLKAEVLDKAVLPVWLVEFNRPSLEKLGSALVEYGVLKKTPDLDALLP